MEGSATRCLICQLDQSFESLSVHWAIGHVLHLSEQVRIAMIHNANATALEGVALLIQAEHDSDERLKSNAYRLISNAGHVARHTLDVQDNEVRKDTKVGDFLLNGPSS
jgi:hypothetical protein